MTPATRLSRAEYEEAAQVYYDSLPLEYFMHSSTQMLQEAITLMSLRELRAKRVPLGVAGELVVQYFYRGNLRQVVPDSMIVGGPLSDEDRKSWILEYESLPICMTMEYVSASSRRKDYGDSFEKYQNELKVPYYLIVDHERDEMHLHHLDEDTGLYQRLPANASGRFAAPELELEVGWLSGWARFWYRGELLPISEELRQQIDELREQIRQRDEAIRLKDEAIRQKEDALSKQSDQLRQKEDVLRQKDDVLRQKDDVLRQKDDALSKQSEQLRQKDAAIRAKEDALRQKDEQFLASLRPIVELRARSASRQDILDQLPTVADAAQLTRWLTELT